MVVGGGGGGEEVVVGGVVPSPRYIGEVVEHWYSRLHDRLVGELGAGAASMGWPFLQVGAATSHLAPDLPQLEGRQVEEGAPMTSAELARLCGELLRVQGEAGEQGEQRTLVMKALVRPLRKRFSFHFLGTKATNNPSKPEWWSTQLVL